MVLINVDTHFPASLAKSDQSLLTMSSPLSSFWVVYLPSDPFTTLRAAYFFFFSKSKDWKTPSMSISKSLYNLFTSTFTFKRTRICFIIICLFLHFSSFYYNLIQKPGKIAMFQKLFPIRIRICWIVPIPLSSLQPKYNLKTNI